MIPLPNGHADGRNAAAAEQAARVPVGPATPVSPTPMVVFARCRTPSASPWATSALTAPCISRRSGGIPASSIFDSLL